MTKQKQISIFFSIFAISILTLVSASSVIAQGRYSARYSKRDVSSIITRLEQSSNRFSRAFALAMDRSSLNGTNAEDRFNANVRDYENSLDQLRREFDRRDSWWESRSNVQNVLREAQPVNRMMNTIAFRRQLERQWTNMRRDLNTLADTYDLPGLNGGGWMGGDWNPGGGGIPGGGGGNVLSWAVGTFYGRNPNSGDTITMNVSPNGSVSIYFGVGGPPTYATLNNRTLRVGTTTSRISSLNNGFRTTRIDNGEIIDYYRNAPGSGGDWNPGGGGNVPSWALGTFYGRNPQSGGNITLEIDASGTVAIRFDNSAPSYATLNGTMLNNQGTQSRVSRLPNGIRTTRVDNGEIINYYRTLR